MGEPSLTSPVANVQPYDCRLKMAFLKGTEIKGSNVNIYKFMQLDIALWHYKAFAFMSKLSTLLG